MSFENVIAYLRKKNNLSQRELAKNLKVSLSTVAMWETGDRKPTNAMLLKLSNYFGVTVDYLLDNKMSSDNITDLFSTLKTPNDGWLPVPIIGEVRAGNGGFIQEEVIGTHLVSPIYKNYINDLFCLIVKGDSMSPEIKENDFVLVRKQKSVDSGSLAVVIINGEEGVVKKVIYNDDAIELHSFNSYYPPRIFKGDDVLKVYIVGKVLEHTRKWG